MGDTPPQLSKRLKLETESTSHMSESSSQADIVTCAPDDPYCVPFPLAEYQKLVLQPQLGGWKKIPADYVEAGKKMKIIARWTNKGGVGKTTTTFSSSWSLAEEGEGRRVLMVDCDAQCNLTQLALNRTITKQYGGNYDYFFNSENFHHDAPKNLFDPLDSFFGGELPLPKPPQLTIVPLQSKEGSSSSEVQLGWRTKELLLLPGSPFLWKLEDQIMVASQGRNKLRLPYVGAFYHLLLVLGHLYKLDVIVLDMSPAVSAMTRVFLMSADFWEIPVYPDFFSYKAITVMTELFNPLVPNDPLNDTPSCWFEWADFICKRLASNKVTKTPMRPPCVRLMGATITRYQPHHNSHKVVVMVNNQQHWKEMIGGEISRLIDAVRVNRPEFLVDYHEVTLQGFFLGELEEFHQLAPIAQRESLPVHELKKRHLRVWNPTKGVFNGMSSNDAIQNKVKRLRAAQVEITRRVISTIE